MIHVRSIGANETAGSCNSLVLSPTSAKLVAACIRWVWRAAAISQKLGWECFLAATLKHAWVFSSFMFAASDHSLGSVLESHLEPVLQPMKTFVVNTSHNYSLLLRKCSVSIKLLCAFLEPILTHTHLLWASPLYTQHSHNRVTLNVTLPAVRTYLIGQP